MTGFTDYVAQGILNHITGKSALFAEPTAYVALFSAVGLDNGTGFTELSGNGYARVATTAGTWNSASGSSPSSISNAATISFPQATNNWTAAIAWGLFDAATSGNLLAWDYLGNYQWLPVTISSASPGVWTSHAHGLSAASSFVYSIEYGGTAPGLVGGSGALTGLLTALSPTTDTFTAENGVTAINTNSTGDGMIRQVGSFTVTTNVVFSFSAAAFTMLCT